MKHLIGPTLAVLLSTAGTALGCRVVGMPLPEIKIATLLAGGLASAVAFGAVLLAHLRHTAPAREKPVTFH